jgi:hypothetical protein
MSDNIPTAAPEPTDDGTRYQTVNVGNIPPAAKYMAVPAFDGPAEVFLLSVLRRDAAGNWQGISLAMRPTIEELTAYIQTVLLAHLRKPAVFWDASGTIIEAPPATDG